MGVNPVPAGTQTLRTQQIVFGALIVGLVTFTIVALVVGPQMNRSGNTGLPQMLNILRLACGALIFGTVAVFPVVKSAHLKNLVNASRAGHHDGDVEDADAFFPAFATINIIGGALAEGPALFAAVILLLSANPLDLLLVVVPLAVLVWRFPTRGRWESFVLAIDRERALRHGE